MSHPLTAAVAAAVLPLVLTGCLGSVSEALQPSDADVVRQAVVKSADADTYTVVETMVGKLPDGTGALIQINARQTVEVRQRPEFAARTSVHRQSIDGEKYRPHRSLAFKDVVFVEVKGLGAPKGTRPWARMSPTEADQMGYHSNMTLVGGDAMYAAVRDVRDLGKSTAAGRPGTRYTGVVSVSKLDGVDAEARKVIKADFKTYGARRMLFDLVVDGDGRLSKVVSKYENAVGKVVATSTEVYSDYGKPVSVARPSKGKVRDMPASWGN